jgi:hypothetical protein
MAYPKRHPDIAPSDWEAIVKEFPSHLVDEVIDRSETDLPPWFVPLARAVAIPSNYLLSEVGHRSGSRAPRGWLRLRNEGFTRWGIDVERSLWVRPCGVRPCGDLWTVEYVRWTRPYEDADKVLVVTLGFMPVFTRSYQSAMRLATHCYLNDPPAGLRWITACSFDGRD